MESLHHTRKMTSTKEAPSIENLYHLDGKISVKQAVPFGLQHILAMFVSNIAPIFIVAGASGLSSKDTAMLIQSAMLIAGIGTLIQLFPIFHKVGSGLCFRIHLSWCHLWLQCHCRRSDNRWYH